MQKTVIKVGPSDHGRRMSLEDFEHAEVQEGRIYELGRGVVVVSDVPAVRHLAQIEAIRRQFYFSEAMHQGRIFTVATGSECKLLVTEFESERHPDLSIYRSPPSSQKKYPWRTWFPDIVIEVESPGSEHRDYVEKREEYLERGIREYWIVDADKEEVLLLRRRGIQWTERVYRPGELYHTRLLPGFEFDCAAVFEAARAAEG